MVTVVYYDKLNLLINFVRILIMFFPKGNIKQFSLILSAALSLSFVNTSSLVKAQTEVDKDKCEYFKEITTDKTKIRKQIKDTVILRNNWNTDFAVPSGTKYEFYVANMMPENTDNYEASIHLKYADGSSDTVYSRNVAVERGETYSLTFQSPTQRQPYQVNIRVGGSNNNAYSISVLGCQ